MLDVASAYEKQSRYRAVVEALDLDIMSDVRRDGMDVVLRDRFTQFIPLDVDFKNREGVLLELYKVAMTGLDTALR